MCAKTIVDASVFAIFDDEGIKRMCRWINLGHGVLVYTTYGKYGQELRKSSRAMEYLGSVRRGAAELIAEARITNAATKLNETAVRSNDAHILQLALAGEAKVLCTDDRHLMIDFLNTTVLPKVNGETRSVYPHNGSRKNQDAFLSDRQCPRR